jgi:hypothetical protein
MFKRPMWKRSPRLEALEEKRLLSAVAPGETIASTAGHVVPLVQELCKGRNTLTNGFTIAPANFNLMPVVGRVQADKTNLMQNHTYPWVAALAVQNQTNSNIPAGQFTVRVAGEPVAQGNPIPAWSKGGVMLFFAPRYVTQFTFRLAGQDMVAGANLYPNVMYNQAAFTTTLTNLINSSLGAGRYRLAAS